MAGIEEYSAMMDQYIRAGDGYIIVCELDNLRSVQEIPALMRKIQRTKEEDQVPMVLIASHPPFHIYINCPENQNENENKLS